jgi:uncharacterized integral membrane protein
VLISIFIGFNLTYTGTIDFLVVKVENAPVFLVVLFSFLTGACVGILASVFKKTKKKRKEKVEKEAEQPGSPDEKTETENQAPERKRGRKKKVK